MTLLSTHVYADSPSGKSTCYLYNEDVVLTPDEEPEYVTHQLFTPIHSFAGSLSPDITLTITEEMNIGASASCEANITANEVLEICFGASITVGWKMSISCEQPLDWPQGTEYWAGANLVMIVHDGPCTTTHSTGGYWLSLGLLGCEWCPAGTHTHEGTYTAEKGSYLDLWHNPPQC